MKKIALFLLIPFLLFSCSAKESSSSQSSPSGKESPSASSTAQRHVHSFQTWETESTCGEDGREVKACSCGITVTKKTSKKSGLHHFDGNGVCTGCGYIDMTSLSRTESIEKYGFYFQDRDQDNCYSTGDSLFFGSYPQKQVEDPDLYDKLSSFIDKLPTSDNHAGFTSYSYYNSGSIEDYAFYEDITCEEKKYRAVCLNSYRPYYSKLEAGEEYSYIDEEGYQLNRLYFFEFSPIEWKILDDYDGNLLLSSKYCLDAQAFQDTYEGDRQHFVIPGTEHNTNEWEHSSIRKFLNSTFLQTAFDEKEQSMISATLLDNAYTSYSKDAKFAIDQNNTEDRIFLLSYQDMLNPDYGFPEKASFDKETNGDNINSVEEAKIRRRSYTPYSVIQGLRTSIQGSTLEGEHACYYMLRSAGIYRYGITGVNKYGSAVYTGAMELTSKQSQDGLSYNADFGVLPNLRLNIRGIRHE